MDKKSISEIKKQFKPERHCLDKIVIRYAGSEGECYAQSKVLPARLNEEDIIRYLELFSQVLTGALEKTLCTLNYQTVDGGVPEQNHLNYIRKSMDDEAVDELLDSIMEQYVPLESMYAIILAHGVYDIPCAAPREDSRPEEDVYEFIICAICPVTKYNAGLIYDREKGCFTNAGYVEKIEKPVNGFLYPAFHDRMEDIHSLLYYRKRPKHHQEGLVCEAFGLDYPMDPDEQQSWLSDTLDNLSVNGCDLKQLSALHEEMLQIKEESNEEIVMANNLFNPKKIVAEAGETKVELPAERGDLLRPMIVEGKPCLVIPISDNHVLFNKVYGKVVPIKSSAEE